MGMFDWYEPVPALRCPSCYAELTGWQGQDSENALIVWRQGVVHPVEHRVDAEVQWSAERLLAQRLPARFSIYTDWSNDEGIKVADGLCRDGVWLETLPGW